MPYRKLCSDRYDSITSNNHFPFVADGQNSPNICAVYAYKIKLYYLLVVHIT